MNRRATVLGTDNAGNLVLQLADSHLGTAPVPRPIVGSSTTGLHTAPPVGAQVLLLHEGDGPHMLPKPAAAVTASEGPAAALPALAPGETALFGADGRAVAHLRADGRTTLWGKAGHPSTEVDGRGTLAVGGALAAGKVYRGRGRLCIFYGTPQAVDGLFDDELAAQQFAAYDLIVLGAGTEDPAYSARASTDAIVARVRALNPNALIAGYVDVGVLAPAANYSLAALDAKIGAVADTLHADLVFLDDYGFDWQCPRSRQNAAVAGAHGRGMGVVANAWVPADALGRAIDATYNPDGTAPLLGASAAIGDYYLAESHCYNSNVGGYAGGYVDGPTIKAKGDACAAYRAAATNLRLLAINTADLSALSERAAATIFEACEVAAHLWDIDAYGLMAWSYGSGGANANLLRPFAYAPLVPQYRGDGTHYFVNNAYTAFVRRDTGAWLDLTPGAQASWLPRPPDPARLVGGQLVLSPLATPAAPTVAPVGAGGSTSYSYYVVAQDRNGAQTPASPAGTTGAGNATLSGSDYNAVAWLPVEGARLYAVLRNGTSGGCLIGQTDRLTLSDVGQTATTFAAPSRNSTADATLGALGLTNATTTTASPAAGGAGALPATPAGYLHIAVNGTPRVVAFY